MIVSERTATLFRLWGLLSSSGEQEIAYRVATASLRSDLESLELSALKSYADLDSYLSRWKAVGIEFGFDGKAHGEKLFAEHCARVRESKAARG